MQVLSFSRMLVHPLLQAYVTRRVSPSFVGTAVAGLEASWPLSTLIGSPLIAIAYAAGGWRGPFVALAVGTGVLGVGFSAALRSLDRRRYTVAPASEDGQDAAAAAVVVAGGTPDGGGARGPAVDAPLAVGAPAHAGAEGRAAPPPPPSLRSRVADFAGDPAVLGCMACVFLKFVVYDGLALGVSKWCVDEYGFSVGDMGTASLVLGVAEISGTASVLLFAERLGFRRFSAAASLAGALAGAALACLVPGSPFVLAAPLVWLTWSTFEAGVVIVMGAASDVRPDMATTSTAVMFVVMGLGRGLGDILGAAAWATGHGPLIVGVATVVIANGLGGGGYYVGDRVRSAGRAAAAAAAAVS